MTEKSPASLDRTLGRIRFGIRAKLVAFIALPFGLVALLIFLFFPRRLEDQALAALTAKGQSIAAMLAFNAAPALYFEDYQTLKEVLASARQNPDLVFLAVFDTAGQLVAGHCPIEAMPPLSAGDGSAAIDRETLSITAPLVFNNISFGSLCLGLSLADLRAKTFHNQRLIALFSLLVFVLGMAAVLVISTVITRPLSRIAVTARRIAAGDLSCRSPVTSGDEVGYLGTVFNQMVDHLQEAHERLEEVNRNLEQRVAERTWELQQEIEERQRAEQLRVQLEEELRQAQKMEAVGQLTAGVAHHFNNMLQIILSSVELGYRETSERGKEFLRDALDATQRAATMVRELMLFSRKISSAKQPVVLYSLLQEVVDLCQNTFDRKIAIALRGGEELPPVLGNPGQLRQAFLNLCLNARDALEEKRDDPRLEIDLELASPADLLSMPTISSDHYVRVRIADNGKGMDEYTRQHLYEPFFTTKEVGQGTGLGLATVYAILQDHQGWITCESALGRGTTFSVYLPAIGLDSQVKAGETSVVHDRQGRLGTTAEKQRQS